MPIAGRWGTVSEAAEHFQVTRQAIHKNMKNGSLGDCKLVDMPRGKVWLIPYPFQRTLGQAGRPKIEQREI